MTPPLKGILVLALFGVLGAGMAENGVAMMKRSGTPPFATGLVTMIPLMPPPPKPIVLALAVPTWRITCWSVAFTVPLIAVACAWRDRAVAGLFVQLIWTIPVMFLGVWIWLFSVFHKIT